MRAPDPLSIEKFSETVQADEEIRTAVEAGQWDRAIDYVNEHMLNRPEEYYTLERLRKAASVDRRLSMREILEKIFELIPDFKSKSQLLEEEFNKFIALNIPYEAEQVRPIRRFFEAYLTSPEIQDVMRTRQYGRLATNPRFSRADFAAVPHRYRKLIPEYVLDYVSLNTFAA